MVSLTAEALMAPEVISVASSMLAPLFLTVNSPPFAADIDDSVEPEDICHERMENRIEKMKKKVLYECEGRPPKEKRKETFL